MKTAVVLLLLGVVASAEAQPAADSARLRRELTQVITAWHQAQIDVVTDPAAARNHWADTYWITNETGRTKRYNKAAEIKADPRDTAQNARVRAKMRVTRLAYDPPVDMAVRWLRPGLVLVNYRETQHSEFNGEPCVKQFCNSQVFEKTRGQWHILSVHETVIPGVPKAYPLDPKVYDDYVGDYRLMPDHVYIITRTGNRLLWARKGISPIELVPEDEHTFVLNGREFYRIRFERNAQGLVTHLRIIEFPGVEYSALKLPAAK